MTPTSSASLLGPLASVLLLWSASTHGNVQSATSTHRLYFVPSPDDIDYDAVGVPAAQFEDVPAHVLENDRGVTVKAMARGGTMVELSLNGTNYLWENIEGGTYYGAETNNFPFKRGLILHGGVRYGAVAPEHGLYYDLDWNMTIDDSNPDSMTIHISIIDDEETRERARNHLPPLGTTQNITGFSGGSYNTPPWDEEGEMTRYPVTNMKYTLSIALRKDEDFVRLKMSVENPHPTESQWAEAWLSTSYPITNQSVILANQTMRWRRDNWCMDDITPSMVEWKDYEFLNRPLEWPMGCIFYDFPHMAGRFHGVTTDQGRGVVYYSPQNTKEAPPHYTKLWSWGAQPWGRGVGDGGGRPASDYYEPWNSGTNFAFFQTRAFHPQTLVSWEIAILPIAEGLDPAKKDQTQLLEFVDQHIDERMTQLSDVQDVQILDMSNESADSDGQNNTSSPTTATSGGIAIFAGASLLYLTVAMQSLLLLLP